MTERILSRRTMLKTAGSVALAGALAGCSSGSGASSGSDNTPEPTDDAGSGGGSGGSPFGGYLDGVSNFDGVKDMTGSSTVTVEVGVDANGGAFGYGPAAIKISKGTTVKWKWTGKGASHNVAEESGAFESKLHSDAGVHFEHTFDSAGTYKYYCTPHKALGMKGGIVVE